jgi:gluconokinase
MGPDGGVIETAQVAYPTLQPAPGYQEQAPEMIWQAFVKCISRITTNQKGSPSAISLSSAMHSVIPVDHSGAPLMNMITWADNRSADVATRIHQSAAGQLIYERSGTPIHAMTPLCKILWLKENEEAIFQKTSRFVSIKEYIWFRLFGEYEVDYSIASATGLFNIDDLVWNDLSLDVCGVTTDRLSIPVNSSHKRSCTSPTLCTLMGLTQGTVFYIGASDGCLANVGSFATEEGYMALTIGTSGAVRVTRNKPMLNFKAMTFNYCLDEKTFVCGGPSNNGGVILKWFAENVLGKKLEGATDYATLLEGMTSSVAGANGLVFLPYLFGERAPIWNSDACGVFFGMRGHHRQEDLIRAVIEGISMALFDITQNMIDAGLDIRQIHVSGGFVHSTAWLQILANIFGKKICLINTADASAIGAAFLALKSQGVITDYLTLKPKECREFIPESEHMDAYRSLFLNYRDLYARVAPLMSGQ